MVCSIGQGESIAFIDDGDPKIRALKSATVFSMGQNVCSLDLTPALGHLKGLGDIAPDNLPALMDL